jgi:hypothetical protein
MATRISTKGIAVDQAFRIANQSANAKQLVKMIRAQEKEGIIPSWFCKAFYNDDGRIVVKNVPDKYLSSTDKNCESWEQVYSLIRDASESGEWRLVSAVRYIKRPPTLGTKEEWGLRLDSETKPLLAHGSPYELSTDKGRPDGWTVESEALIESIMERDPNTKNSLAATARVKGAQGFAVIVTAEVNEKEPLKPIEIVHSILHELAGHAGLTTRAGKGRANYREYLHSEPPDENKTPADNIKDFLDTQFKPQVKPDKHGFFLWKLLLHPVATLLEGSAHASKLPSRPLIIQRDLLQRQQREQMGRQQEESRRLVREEMDRMRENRERMDRERQQREQLQRQQRERTERERQDRERRERMERERQQREQREKANRDREDRARRERMERQRQEQQRMEIRSRPMFQPYHPTPFPPFTPHGGIVRGLAWNSLFPAKPPISLSSGPSRIIPPKPRISISFGTPSVPSRPLHPSSLSHPSVPSGFGCHTAHEPLRNSWGGCFPPHHR